MQSIFTHVSPASQLFPVNDLGPRLLARVAPEDCAKTLRELTFDEFSRVLRLGLAVEPIFVHLRAETKLMFDRLLRRQAPS